MTPVDIEDFVKKNAAMISRRKELDEYFESGCECAELGRFGSSTSADVTGYDCALLKYFSEKRGNYKFFTRKAHVYICTKEAYEKMR